jgi:hypothetical protein
VEGKEVPTNNPTTLINSISEEIEERLTPGIRDSLPRLDPFTRYLYSTAMGVERGTNLGRDWKVLHTLTEGMSGVFEWRDAGGTQPQQFTGTAHFVAPGAPEGYPGLDESVNPGLVRKTISLVKGTGNLFIPHEFLRADQSDAAIGKAVARIIRGAATNIAMADIHSLYAMDSFKSIGTVGAVSYGDSNTTATIVVKYNSVRALRGALGVDIYDSTGATRRNEGLKLFVDNVRFIPDEADAGYGAINVRARDNSVLNGLGIVAGDIIVRANSISKGPLGPEQWLVTTGTVFGIDVAEYEQFKSIVDTSVGGTFTEKVWNKYAGRFKKACGREHFPDTWVTSDGVMNAHVNNSDGLSRFDRTGRLFDIKVGYEFGETPFIYGGMKCRLITSDFMPTLSLMTSGNETCGGRMWGMKTRERNLVRYLPPRLPGAASDARFGREVEFTCPLMNSIFTPMHTSDGRISNYQEAPLDRWIAIAPEWMPGVLLGGLAEDL